MRENLKMEQICARMSRGSMVWEEVVEVSEGE
jgi:hypothetical protein